MAQIFLANLFNNPTSFRNISPSFGREISELKTDGKRRNLQLLKQFRWGSNSFGLTRLYISSSFILHPSLQSTWVAFWSFHTWENNSLSSLIRSSYSSMAFTGSFSRANVLAPRTAVLRSPSLQTNIRIGVLRAHFCEDDDPLFLSAKEAASLRFMESHQPGMPNFHLLLQSDISSNTCVHLASSVV